MHDPFIKRWFEIDRGTIAYLRFILEGYDGLIFLRTLDSRTALVEVAYAPSCREPAGAVLEALIRECGLREVVEPPAGLYPPL